ncbi:hypothetical protein HYX05_05085 [Candidatus Woesearchaeota archaeon]|nr:hypothetical protein [Candidatus Woesearchaeota archaeon]
MKWIKAILAFFTMILISMVLMNLLLGDGTRPFIQLLMFQLSRIIFAVPFIATCLIFASELEKAKKVKWTWITLGIYLVILIVILIILVFFGAMFGKVDDRITSILIFGSAYIVGMVLATALLSYLLKLEEGKQMKIILVVFLIVLLLDLLQLFGLFRPQLIMPFFAGH